MEQLNRVQKAFHIFEILTKIAYICSIVGASICAVGALCAVSYYSGGQVFSLFGEPLAVFPSAQDLSQTLAVLLSDTVLVAVEAVLFFFANRYLKAEQAAGTPFTDTGADLLRKLGIRCIWMPIVAMVIVSAIAVSLGAELPDDISNLPSVMTGVGLIITSMIFRYGAALEEKAKH